MGFINALPGAVAQGIIWGIMAIGVYITYKIMDIADLTVDGSICTGACVLAVLLTNGVNVGVAMLVAFLAGCACGLITAIFHTVFGIPAILSGILTQLMLWSINLKILGRANMPVNELTGGYKILISMIEKGRAIGILCAFFVVIIGLLYWFFGTEYGSGLRATGCNPKMAKAQGINVNLGKVFALMLSNGLVALSGALLAQYQGFADINMGRGAIVIGLAAVIIGGAFISWMPKVGKNYKSKGENDYLDKFFKGFQKVGTNFATQLVGVIIGGIVYYIVYQGVIAMGLDTDLLKMLSALIVGLFLAVPYLRKKYSFKKIAKKFGWIKKSVVVSPDNTSVDVDEAPVIVDENDEHMDTFNVKLNDDEVHRTEEKKDKE